MRAQAATEKSARAAQTFVRLGARLRARPDAAGQRAALALARAEGLDVLARQAYGESALELCARLGAQEACLALMAEGADPFEEPRCLDALGRHARLRAFEAMVASDMPAAIEAAAARAGRSALPGREAQWRALSRETHPQLRLWRAGGGWIHLAAAAGAARSVAALGSWGFGAADLDDSGSGPLLACARARAPAAFACACALLDMGADPWAGNALGERAVDAMPPEWLALAAQAESAALGAACAPGSEGSGRSSRSL